MPTVQPLPAPPHEIYDPDDVGLHNSPMLKPMKINLQPSPSPPPDVPLPPVSPDSSPGPPDRKLKHRPSQGDAVLIAFMAGGKNLDIARNAGEAPLASEAEGEETVPGTTVVVEERVEKEEVPQEREEAIAENDGRDLLALAADALRHTTQGASDAAQRVTSPKSPT